MAGLLWPLECPVMEEIEGIGDMEVVGVVATETGEIVVVAADMEVEGIEDMVEDVVVGAVADSEIEEVDTVVAGAVMEAEVAV